MRRLWWILLAAIFLGCSPLGTINRPGLLVDQGLTGSARVVGVGNASKAATLEREEESMLLTHKEGDRITVTETPDERIVVYEPKRGAKTAISLSKMKSSTGASFEDKSIISAQIFKNTKFIQYAGVFFVVAGMALGTYLKKPIQGAITAGTGIGLIVLQSTLANPIWSWVMVGLLIGLPVAWFWRMRTGAKTNVALVKSIEQMFIDNPGYAKKAKEILRSNMLKSEKQYVKEIKEIKKI